MAKKQTPEEIRGNEIKEFSKNKWKFLANRIARSTGGKRKWTSDKIREEFIKYVEFYSESKTVYVSRSRQKKAKDNAEAQLERVERIPPMTEVSFCVWLGQADNWFCKMCATYKEKYEDEKYRTDEDIAMYELLMRIKAFLSSQVLEGAIVGEYVHNIVTPLLGMKNQVDVTSNGQSAVVPVINLVQSKKQREGLKDGNKGE